MGAGLIWVSCEELGEYGVGNGSRLGVEKGVGVSILV